MSITKIDYRLVRGAILNYIMECYVEWDRGRLTVEPRLTVVHLRDYVREISIGASRATSFHMLSKARQSSVVRSILESLVRHLYLVTNIGQGERGPARCYEPRVGP